MARKPRIWYENACYHITCRGNHRNDLFRDEGDFGVYLELISDVIKHYQDTPYTLISYCLMDNHVHLLIQTSNRHIGDFMKRVNMHYAIYFNKRYNYVGHLFQDRFYSELVITDTQLLETSRYIHLNPVRAKMVILPEEYTWSSYSELIAIAQPSLVNPEKLWSYFKKGCGPKLYQKFVAVGKLPIASQDTVARHPGLGGKD